MRRITVNKRPIEPSKLSKTLEVILQMILRRLDGWLLTRILSSQDAVLQYLNADLNNNALATFNSELRRNMRDPWRVYMNEVRRASVLWRRQGRCAWHTFSSLFVEHGVVTRRSPRYASQVSQGNMTWVDHLGTVIHTFVQPTHSEAVSSWAYDTRSVLWYEIYIGHSVLK